MTAPVSHPRISIVVPFFDEAEVAVRVVDEIGAAATALEAASGFSWGLPEGVGWEAILVNDGSRDQTGRELQRAAARWPQCQVLDLPKNQGQGIALFRGIQEARAPLIATMDGDGQNVPADIGALLRLIGQADMIVGVRADRRDSRTRRGISRLANAVRRRLLRDGLSDAGCALKLFRREVAAGFRPLPMLNCFMPAFALAGGFRVIEHPVGHRARAAGRSKYGLRGMSWRPCADLLAVWWTLRKANSLFKESASHRHN